jgi:hypothetical protein
VSFHLVVNARAGVDYQRTRLTGSTVGNGCIASGGSCCLTGRVSGQAALVALSVAGHRVTSAGSHAGSGLSKRASGLGVGLPKHPEGTWKVSVSWLIFSGAASRKVYDWRVIETLETRT